MGRLGSSHVSTRSLESCRAPCHWLVPGGPLQVEAKNNRVNSTPRWDISACNPAADWQVHYEPCRCSSDTLEYKFGFGSLWHQKEQAETLQNRSSKPLQEAVLFDRWNDTLLHYCYIIYHYIYLYIIIVLLQRTASKMALYFSHKAHILDILGLLAFQCFKLLEPGHSSHGIVPAGPPRFTPRPGMATLPVKEPGRLIQSLPGWSTFWCWAPRCQRQIWSVEFLHKNFQD